MTIGRIATFIASSIPTHQHGISLSFYSLLLYSFITFYNTSCKVLTFLIPRYIIILIVLLNIFSFWLLRHINVINFCILVLHPAALLNLTIHSPSLWILLGFLFKQLHHLQIMMNIFLPLWFIYYLFIFPPLLNGPGPQHNAELKLQ